MATSYHHRSYIVFYSTQRRTDLRLHSSSADLRSLSDCVVVTVGDVSVNDLFVYFLQELAKLLPERKKLTSGFCPDAGMSRYNPFTSVSRISNSADNSERRKMALDFNSCLDLPPALPSK